MSKLIQLRQRIHAIETIKKITHAMRLIAMSSHSQLKQSQGIITGYTHELNTLFLQLLFYAPTWRNSILHPDTKKSFKTAFIIVGSQKGLCGSFNSHLFRLALKKLDELSDRDIDIIPVGQKAVEFCNSLSIGSVKHAHPKFSMQHASSISHEIAHSILHMEEPYRAVFVASNSFKNFFVQSPRIHQIIPVQQNTIGVPREKDDLLWEQTPEEILDELVAGYVTPQIQVLLYESLLSEHAARFVSMDSATRNANGLLEATNLEYNKLRQAKITKEITELSGSFN